MSVDIAEALGWRTQLIEHLSTLRSSLTDLSTTDLEDVADHINMMDSEMDDVDSAIPCEQGIVEFAGGGDDAHDECYHADDVAVTTDDLRNASGSHWDTVQSNQLIRFSEMADTLETVLEGTRIRWTRRAIEGMISQLRDETFRPDEDLTDYLADEETT